MSATPNLDLYADWPADKRSEIIENWDVRDVGSRVVSETETLRIWHLELRLGERAPFHRHDESYFWTSIGPGKSRSYYHDGSVKETEYEAGATMHFDISDGEFFVHDLNNTGDTTLTFVTVEFKRQ